MNKSELVNYVAGDASLTQASAHRVVDALIKGITSALQTDGELSLTGFGTFSVVDRASRAARNPRTGELIQTKACKMPKFRPGKMLKEALN